MRRLLIAAAATAALALAACGTATPYQPLRAGSAVSGGFTDRQIEANRWMVGFSGNSLTDRKTVETYLLYRSAELTLAQGGDWFEMVDRQTDRNTRVYADPLYDPWGFGGAWGPTWRLSRRGYGWSPWSRWGGWGAWGGWGPGGIGPADYDTVTQYEANAEIVTHRGPKPTDNARAFDAHQVVDRLGPSIVRPA